VARWNTYRFWEELAPEEKEEIFWEIVKYHPLPCRIYWSTTFLAKFLRVKFRVLIRIRGAPLGDKSCYLYFKKEFREWCRRNGIPVLFPKKTPSSKKAFITPSIKELEALDRKASR